MVADNQQGSRQKLYKLLVSPSETTRRSPYTKIYQAYLQGALHDGTFNRFHRTFRFVQKEKSWLLLLQKMFRRLNIRSWIYREGKQRDLFALETKAHFLKIRFDPKVLLTRQEKIAYIRGYFDAEGGIPQFEGRWYIQFTQKNLNDIKALRLLLKTLRIACGIIHNPSYQKDPNYWRFYILHKSHIQFIKMIGSWHPRKLKIFQKRMMI